MKKSLPIKPFTMAAILLSGMSLPAFGQTVLGPRVLAGGGSTQVSASHVLKVTLGQTITGKTTGGSIFSGLGFWEQLNLDSATGLPEEAPVFATRLLPNVPNPFNPSTKIHFSLAAGEQVLMEVFDLQGRRVARLLDESLPAGEHTLQYRPDGLASGIYLLRLSAGKHHESRRLVLLK
jgi:hypothetical protein